MASCDKSDFYRHVASLDESDKFVTTCRQQLRQAGKQPATILWRFWLFKSRHYLKLLSVPF